MAGPGISPGFPFSGGYSPVAAPRFAPPARRRSGRRRREYDRARSQRRRSFRPAALKRVKQTSMKKAPRAGPRFRVREGGRPVLKNQGESPRVRGGAGLAGGRRGAVLNPASVSSRTASPRTPGAVGGFPLTRGPPFSIFSMLGKRLFENSRMGLGRV